MSVDREVRLRACSVEPPGLPAKPLETVNSHWTTSFTREPCQPTPGDISRSLACVSASRHSRLIARTSAWYRGPIRSSSPLAAACPRVLRGRPSAANDDAISIAYRAGDTKAIYARRPIWFAPRPDFRSKNAALILTDGKRGAFCGHSAATGGYHGRRTPRLTPRACRKRPWRPRGRDTSGSPTSCRR